MDFMVKIGNVYKRRKCSFPREHIIVKKLIVERFDMRLRYYYKEFEVERKLSAWQMCWWLWKSERYEESVDILRQRLNGRRFFPYVFSPSVVVLSEDQIEDEYR